MRINNSSEFITQIIEDSVDSNILVYKAPTREALVKIVKGLEKLGYETRGKSKEAVLYQVQDLIRNSQGLSNRTKKNAQEIVTLFINAYPGLYEKSINEKNKKLQTEIETNNFQKQEILQNGWGDQAEIIKSKEAATSENIDDLTRAEIEEYSASNGNCLQGEELQKLRGLKYSRARNSNKIVQHTLGDIQCTSMISEQYPRGSFLFSNLNKEEGNGYLKGRNFDNLQSNYFYNHMLKLSGSVHQSLKEHNRMIFGIMQQIADQLGLDVTIGLNFVDNSNNDTTTELLLKGMRSIFGADFVIPYKLCGWDDPVSYIHCNDDLCAVTRNTGSYHTIFASFSAIGSSAS